MTSRLAIALAKLDARGLELVYDRYLALATLAVEASCDERRMARRFVMLSASERLNVP